MRWIEGLIVMALASDEARPSQAAFAMISRMPGFAFRMLLSNSARDLLSSFGKHAESSKDLQQRILLSPRRGFYEQMRCRIEGAISDVSLVQHWAKEAVQDAGEQISLQAPPPALTQESSASPSETSDGAETAMYRWEDFSQQLPEDWADCLE
mmetsp:Transcript_98888/g.280093  ORF Transcript_98888/g.280093 Transcript_98888/m.280093 type:complete len:153 (-) Transcript_98888:63-521(-)